MEVRGWLVGRSLGIWGWAVTGLLDVGRASVFDVAYDLLFSSSFFPSVSDVTAEPFDSRCIS